MNESDFYIKKIYTHGGCYQFFKILKTVFPDAEPYLCGGFNGALEKEWFDHVVIKIDGLYYDILGEFKKENSRYEFIRPLKNSDLKTVENWRFTNVHFIPDCEECDFPILVDELRKKLNA